MTGNKNMFRKKSLEKLSTPERLDELLRVVKPRSWFLLATIGAFLALCVAWGFVGRLPETAQGNALLVYPRQMIQSGARTGSMETEDRTGALTVLAYFQIQDGKKIEKGMKARVSPVTVERHLYGSLLGVVESVSEYPVTREAVSNQIGNSEVAQDLTSGGRGIEVLVRLEKDPQTRSGYRWTSAGGPDVQISAGTTAIVRITTRTVAPAQLVIPALESWIEAD